MKKVSSNTQLFFIVGSGRSGTAALQKVLETYPEVEVHHEYMVHHVQPLAFMFRMGLLNCFDVIRQLIPIYNSAMFYSSKELWGDSSNKVSWLIKPLVMIFPRVKFLHIVRDGRKVVSSYFHKLNNECYHPTDVKVMRAWLETQNGTDKVIPQPPPEKKYWWPLPTSENTLEWDQFQIICWHWRTINRTILDSFKSMPKSSYMTVKLEELVKDERVFASIIDFLGLSYDVESFKLLKRPHNVSEPVDYPLTEQQTEQFWDICAATMHHFGYEESEEYRVEYHPA
jgi:hypothetical protein